MLALSADNLRRAGVRHGFSLRTGGVSAPPFDTLNLGRSVGDDPASVAENHRRFAAELGYSEVHDVSQVHGATVHVVRGETPAVLRTREGDAQVARVVGSQVAVGVRVADCAPVLLADRAAGLVAAVHAGWRGAAAGVVAAAVRVLVDEGADASRLVAAFGPHIRACCFEVGDEVVDALGARLTLEGTRAELVGARSESGKPHADLAAFLRASLAALGVRDIEDVPGCTRCDAARFYSFRRDGKRSGRHMAVIVAG